jgi:hypothetical protein
VLKIVNMLDSIDSDPRGGSFHAQNRSFIPL